MPDSIYRLRERDLLAVCVLGLLGLGALMVQSAAVDVAGGTLLDGGQIPLIDWGSRATKHALYATLAFLTFMTVSRLDYRRLVGTTATRSPAVWFAVLAGLACVAVLVPGIGAEVNGARRWLRIGPVTVQPSELAKWGVVMLLAWRLSRPTPFTLARGFLPTAAAAGMLCLLVVIQDFGTAALIGSAAFCLFLVGPVRTRWLVLSGIPALSAAFYFVYSEPYRWRRIIAFLDPWAAPETDGYHVIQSLYSFAGGGWMGRGLGNGVQKLGYLPEDTTDFIFAVVSEELGIFGAGLLALAYLTLLGVGYAAARKSEDPFGRLLAYGVVVTIGLQASINVAVATASVPTKGIALPLVSAGGSGLITTAAMLGLVYSVARGGRHQQQPDGAWEQLLREDKKKPEPDEVAAED